MTHIDWWTDTLHLAAMTDSWLLDVLEAGKGTCRRVCAFQALRFRQDPRRRTRQGRMGRHDRPLLLRPRRRPGAAVRVGQAGCVFTYSAKCGIGEELADAETVCN